MCVSVFPCVSTLAVSKSRHTPEKLASWNNELRRNRFLLSIMLQVRFTRLALLKEVPIIQDRDERIDLMNKNKGIRDVFFSFQKAIGTYGK